MLMTTDTLDAALYIKEKFGQQDVNGLTEKEVMSLVDSIKSLDLIVDSVVNNKDFDLYAIDRLDAIMLWVRNELSSKKQSIYVDIDFKKKAKLFSNFINRLTGYRIDKYKEMTSLNRFINEYR